MPTIHEKRRDANSGAKETISAAVIYLKLIYVKP